LAIPNVTLHTGIVREPLPQTTGFAASPLLAAALARMIMARPGGWPGTLHILLDLAFSPADKAFHLA